MHPQGQPNTATTRQMAPTTRQMARQRPLSESNPQLKAACAEFEASVAACDPARVGAAFDQWAAAVSAAVHQVPLVGGGWTMAPSKEDCAAIWSEMHWLIQLATRLNASTEPGAVACGDVLARRIRSGLEHELSGAHYQDDGVHGAGFCSVPLKGAPEPTLRLLLARYAVYNGWCYRHWLIWNDLQRSADSTPRMLQRALLFVAGLCEFECVDHEWHTLAHSAAEKNQSTFEDTTDLLELLSGRRVVDESDWEYGHPKRLKNDAMRSMIEAMYVARATGQTRTPAPSPQQLDLLTYAAGQKVIEQVLEGAQVD